MTTPYVRAADIAAMANVTRAAVTQWRKRYDNFPAPKEDVDSDSPLFDRHEVEEWLRARNRLQNTPRRRTPRAIARRIADHLRGIADVRGGVDLAGAALAAEYVTRTRAIGARGPASLKDLPDEQALTDWLTSLASSSPDLSLAVGGLQDGRRETAEFVQAFSRIVEDVKPESFGAVYDELLGLDRRHLADPAPLSDLLHRLARLDDGTVLDPAAGMGFTLLAFGKNPRLRLVGVDVDGDVRTIAIRRFLLADREVDYRIGDSLGDDPAQAIRADVVVSIPPWGIRAFRPSVDVHDPRWAFGRPRPRTDGIWLQQAIFHLAEDGRAFVVTPRNELVRRVTEELRLELLRRGTIEAVINLPAGFFRPYASIGTAVWVLARPGENTDPNRVLLVDIPSTDDAVPSAALDAVVEAYRRWREHRHAHESSHVMVVSVRELLEPGVGLAPDVWLARRDAPTARELIDQIRVATDKLVHSPATTSVDLPDFTPAPVSRRERLSHLPGVTIARGVPHSSLRSSVSDDSLPVLTTSDLRDYAEHGILHATGCIDPADLSGDNEIVRRGDILLSTIHGFEGVRSTKIDDDGWVVESPAYIIRVDDTAIDGDYLMACINARLQQPDGEQFLRTQPPGRIEVPVISLDEQRIIGGLLRDLAASTQRTQQLVDQLRRLTNLVEAAAGEGALASSDPLASGRSH